jgi:hypothetical protein
LILISVPEGRKRAKSISVSPILVSTSKPGDAFQPETGQPKGETETENESWFRDLKLTATEGLDRSSPRPFSANETRPRPSVRVETERVGTESNVETETLELKGTLKAKGKAVNPFRLKPK